MDPSSTLVRILDFQYGETGSSPVGATKIRLEFCLGHERSAKLFLRVRFPLGSPRKGKG